MKCQKFQKKSKESLMGSKIRPLKVIAILRSLVCQQEKMLVTSGMIGKLRRVSPKRMLRLNLLNLQSLFLLIKKSKTMLRSLRMKTQKFPKKIKPSSKASNNKPLKEIVILKNQEVLLVNKLLTIGMPGTIRRASQRIKLKMSL
jgi:hypothetical protein